ncbi:MAG: hypothetical protein ABIK73_09370 [candidate division WOR-3 bacterium]
MKYYNTTMLLRGDAYELINQKIDEIQEKVDTELFNNYKAIQKTLNEIRSQLFELRQVIKNEIVIKLDQDDPDIA